MKKELLIGMIGKDKVILEVELKNNNGHGKITTALTPAPIEYKTLSISGSIGNHSGGQIHDSINPSDFDELYMDRDELIHLLAIWKTCHLNDACAGSLKQMELINFWRDQIKTTSGWDYNEACTMLKQHDLLIDNETNPELKTGYKYGTLWLINILPDDVIEFISNLQSTPFSRTRSAIMDYLIDNKYTWDIRLTSNNPNTQSDDIEMDHWKVKLFNQHNEEFKVYFSTGIGHRLMSKDRYANQFKINNLLTNWKRKTVQMMGFKPKQMRSGQVTDDYKTVQELGFHPPPIGSVSQTSNMPFQGVRVPPMPDQVIECVCGDWLSIENYHSWEDWGNDLGYDFNSKSDRQKARRAYENSIDQSDEAQDFFGSDWNELCDRSY